LAQGLLEYETLSGDDIQKIIKGEKPVRETPTSQKPKKRKTSKTTSVPTGGGADLGPQEG